MGTPSLRRSLALLPLVLPAVVPGSLHPSDSTDPFTSGPAVSIRPGEVAPGDNAVVTIDGFHSSYVTISVCGNESRRGSADCNMAASQGAEVPQDGTQLLVQIPVAEPPADCPCVVRVVGRDSTEIAVVPLKITGHRIGPVIDPPIAGPLVAVSVDARESPTGALDAIRAQLGGPTMYEVTVTVRNTSTSPLQHVLLSGSAGRGADDDVARLDLDDPGLIAVGQSWRQTVTVRVPAPSFGNVEWRVAASGAGPTVTEVVTSRHRPILLIVLGLLAVTNIGLLGIRWRVRGRAVKAAARAVDDGGRWADAPEPAPDAAGPGIAPGSSVRSAVGGGQLVGTK